MSNFSDQLADRLIEHSLDIYRFDSGTRKDVIKLLNSLKSDVADQLKRMDANLLGTVARQQRLKMILAEIERILKIYYGRIRNLTIAELASLAKVEALYAGASINNLAGVSIMLNYKLTSPFVRALVSNVLIEGAPTRTWWARQATGTKERFTDQLRLGVGLGESNDKLIQRVIGSFTGKYQTVIDDDGVSRKIPVYSGGVMETSRRNAESLIRSSVQAVSNAARNEVYKNNSDILIGMQALVVLDGNTSLICIGRSNAVWDLDGNPLQLVDYPMPGPPPWHWNCRTILNPVLKSWQDISNVRNIRVAPTGATQASMDGQVAADLSFEKWMQTKSESFQKRKLGPTRYKLWKSGKLRITDLVDQYNRILTVEQLEAKIAA